MQFLAKPFESLPRPLYIVLVFFWSAAYHIVCYYPRRHRWVIYPHIHLFVGSGFACIAERAFRQVTGRRVCGRLGRIWTWTVLYMLIQPLVSYDYSSGWIGVWRGSLVKMPEVSPAVNTAYLLGLGPSASEIRQSQGM